MSITRRSPKLRQAVLATLPESTLADIRAGRARVTRTGRIVRADDFKSGRIHGLDENPNRGKRGVGRLPGHASDDPIILRDRARGEAVAIARPFSYSPLTVTTPARDSLGRRAPRSRPTSYTI